MMKPFKQEKILYTIQEVAKMFNINASTLRYWEKEFDSIRPVRSEKGTRQYSKEDIEEIRLVHYMLKEKGLTIDGTKKRMNDNKESVIHTDDIVQRLKFVRSELWNLKGEIEDMEKHFSNLEI